MSNKPAWLDTMLTAADNVLLVVAFAAFVVLLIGWILLPILGS